MSETRAIAPHYWVTSEGRVLSDYSGSLKTLRPATSKSGHQNISLTIDGKQKQFFIHQLVLRAFRGDPPEGMISRHLDGDPSNNHLSNLVYGTRSENAQDAIRHGQMVYGSRHGNAKLTEEDVKQIRELFESGYSNAEIARTFDVCPQHVGKLRSGKRWIRFHEVSRA